VKPIKSAWNEKSSTYEPLSPQTLPDGKQKLWVADDIATYRRPPYLTTPNLPKNALAYGEIGPGTDVEEVIIFGIHEGEVKTSTGRIVAKRAPNPELGETCIEIHYASTTAYGVSGCGIFHPKTYQLIGIHQGIQVEGVSNRGRLFTQEQLDFARAPLPKPLN
jgi:hypothetical protein